MHFPGLGEVTMFLVCGDEFLDSNVRCEIECRIWRFLAFLVPGGGNVRRVLLAGSMFEDDHYLQ